MINVPSFESEDTNRKNMSEDSLNILNGTHITVELGRSKQTENGKLQNIQVYINGVLVLDSDTNNGGGFSDTKGFMYLLINKTDTPIKILTNDAKDERYIFSKQAYVGNINLPKDLRGKGFAQKIYQQVADTLGVEIVKGDDISQGSQAFWEKHKSFKPH